jgi:putative inorganic carbon (HCO3(-)) transporter
LHDQAPTTNFDTLTLNNSRGRFGSIDRPNESEIKRSQGIFRHPAIAAGLCGLVLPIVLAYLVSAQRNRDRILLFLVFVWGFVALLLTFSRAGFIGFIAGTLVFITVGGGAGLISRKVAALSGIAVVLLLTLSLPFLLVYLKARSETFFMRFYMFEAAVQGYSQHPILGVGLNNSTVAMKDGKQELRDMGIPVATKEPADSYYLAILTEVGPLGSILFFGFFVNIVMIALDSMREVAAEMKPLLVGMVAGLAALATQSIADGPLAGHAVGSTLWLFAALIVAIRRFSPAETRPFIEGGKTTFVGVGARSFPPHSVRALGL